MNELFSIRRIDLIFKAQKKKKRIVMIDIVKYGAPITVIETSI